MAAKKLDDRIVRLVLPLLLVAGVSSAALVFVRSHRGTESQVITAPSSDAAAMEAAHAAAGVQVGAPVGPAAEVFERRLSDLDTKLQAAPADRGLVLALARLLHDGHRTTEAVARYEQAIDMDPTDAQTYYDLASAHASDGGWNEANDALLRLLDLQPNDPMALYDLAAVRANQGLTAEAREYLAKARAVATDGELLALISRMAAQLDETLSR